MPKPILYVTRRLPPAVEARAARDYDARLNPDDHPVGAQDILAGTQGAHALLCCPAERLDAALIAALPASLRVIGTFSVGTDHIDLDAARARGLPVVNTPDVLSVATAELAMLLILAAARRAGEGERLVRAGRWTGWTPTQMLGTGVSGRRLGIFGMGRIGRELATMARGFGMAIHYRNRTRLPRTRKPAQSSTRPTKPSSPTATSSPSTPPAAPPPATGSTPPASPCFPLAPSWPTPPAAPWWTTPPWWQPCKAANSPPPAWTFTTASRGWTRPCSLWRTSCCFHTWAALRQRRGTLWA